MAEKCKKVRGKSRKRVQGKRRKGAEKSRKRVQGKAEKGCGNAGKGKKTGRALVKGAPWGEARQAAGCMERRPALVFSGSYQAEGFWALRRRAAAAPPPAIASTPPSAASVQGLEAGTAETVAAALQSTVMVMVP